MPNPSNYNLARTDATSDSGFGGDSYSGSWLRYGSPAVAPVDERYLDHYRGMAQRAQDEEIRTAGEMLRKADRAAELQGGINRGEAANSIIGSGRAGDALGARRALTAGGRALGNSVGETLSSAGQSRMNAVGNVLSAHGRTAEYEKAMYDDYMRRLVAMQSYTQRARAAAAARDEASKDSSASLLRTMVGGFTGGAGGMASAMGGPPGGQQPQQGGTPGANYNAQSTTGGSIGAYANAPGGYVNNQGMKSGADYYSSAYEDYYGR